MTRAQDHLKNGELTEALSALKEEVRERPQDPRLRVFLFQLDVLAHLNADTMLLAEIFRPIIVCEMLRRDIFEKGRTPIIFGQPTEWISQLVKANEYSSAGQNEAALALRDKAFEAAPAIPGKLNGVPFEWISDADSRFGPIVEAIIQGKYYWIPFFRIQKINIAKPADLRDLVWAPAQFIWANGGEASGHIPCRYPKTEQSPDDALRLARKTEWVEPLPGFALGLGQRLWTTDQEDYPLLECRELELDLPGEVIGK